MASPKNMPKDLQAMSNILKEFEITDYESGVENHLLDLSIRHITSLIEETQLYSSHAKKKSIDVDDVKLAIELQHQVEGFACPPSRELTATLARQRNSLPLPTIRSSAGLRLPPDRHNLTACNFHLKSYTKKPRAVHALSRMNVSNLPSTSTILPRSTFNIQKTLPCPIIKYSEANKSTNLSPALSPILCATPGSTSSPVPSSILMPTVLNNEVKLSNDIISIKRSHEDDDDYDINV